MAKTLAVFGDEYFEEVAHIKRDIGIGILLNHQRAGGVLNKQSEQTVANALFSQPIFGGTGEWIESFAASIHFQGGVCGAQNPL